MRTKLFFLVLLISVGLYAEAPFEGSGTELDPYRIGTVEELEAFRDAVSGSSNNVYGAANVHYLLTSDIDLSSIESWAPIGISGRTFKGVFNGGGHIINNLTITGSGNNLGLFGYTAGTTVISDLAILNIDISANSNAGGVVGVNLGKIENCYTTGRITGTSTNGMFGGIAGRSLMMPAGAPFITNTYSSVSITGVSYLGGIIGSEGGGRITNVVSVADSIVSTAAEGVIGGDQVGRISGYNNPGTPAQGPIPAAPGTAVENLYSYDGLSVDRKAIATTIADGTDATLTELQTEEFYKTTLSWDFDNLWTIWEGNSFPYFQGQSAPVVISTAFVDKTISGLIKTDAVLDSLVVIIGDEKIVITDMSGENTWECATPASAVAGTLVSVTAFEQGKSASYTVTKSIEVDDEQSGIGKTIAKNQYVVYPTIISAGEPLYVEGEDAAVSIYSIQGTIVYQSNLSEGSVAIPTAEIAAGTYILRILPASGDVNIVKIQVK